MSEPVCSDGRLAKWILLLTLVVLLVARLAAGAEPGAEQAAPNATETAQAQPPASGGSQPPGVAIFPKARRAACTVLVDGHYSGTGFFIDPQGLAVTAAHVIERPGRHIELLSPVAGRVDARLLAVDLGHDVALLQAAQRDAPYPMLELAKKVPPPGDDVFLFGFPIFRPGLMLRGMVATEQRVFEFLNDHYMEGVHIATTAQSGTSGGAWLNRQGRVVGVQSMVMSSNGIPIGVAGMARVDAIHNLVQTRRNAATPTMRAAFEELWQHGPDVLKRFAPGTEALALRAIASDGPAARAGLKEWDAITEADGKRVVRWCELLRIIRSKQPGDVLRLKVIGPDGTGTRQVDVKLGCLETGWPDAAGEAKKP